MTISDKKIGVDNNSDGIIDYYNADVVTANDYYPFGMIMPGRKYEQTPGKSYRYSINGQEKEKELNENITTALYWEYDSRIGRRWNVDPVFKEYESPYAAFGNNPIWNMDPNGADTTKSLSNNQLGDAMKIASSEVKSVLKDKRKYHSKEVDKNLFNAIDNYQEKNKLTLGQSKEFQESVQQYYEGLSTVAWWSGAAEFEQLDRALINNPGVPAKRALQLTIASVRNTEAGMWGILGQSVNTALFISSAALFPQVGAKPSVPNMKPGPALRQAYESEVKGIKSWVSAMRGQGATSEEIARTVQLQRRLLGVKYKDLTPPKLLETIYKRNMEKYGDKLGPSVDWLRGKGKSWDDIIESASRPGGKDINF